MTALEVVFMKPTPLIEDINMSKLELGQRVKSSWTNNATGVVVFRGDTGESLPAFDEHPDADFYRCIASDADDFIVLFDDTQAEWVNDKVAGELEYGYDNGMDFKAME